MTDWRPGQEAIVAGEQPAFRVKIAERFCFCDQCGLPAYTVDTEGGQRLLICASVLARPN